MKNDQLHDRKVCGIAILIALLPVFSAHAEQERFIALNNKGLWPQLTLFPDGDLVAAVFNQPSHGLIEGDVEVWGSTDYGDLWKLRGTPTKHDPRTNRMNVATGLAHNTDFIVLASGLGGKGFRGIVLPVMISRSSDHGRNWTRSLKLDLPDEINYLIPFGDIVRLEGRTLAAAFYGQAKEPKSTYSTGSYVLFSYDDGLTWGDGVRIGASDYTETTLLRLKTGSLLAAARTRPREHGAYLELLSSEDDGQTWVEMGPLTLPTHHPADMMQLQDGSVLLTYGIREKGHNGIGIRVSSDEGKTWSAPNTIVELEGTTDGGYPSTVQLPDGSLVTAYYSNGITQHQHYHMGVVHWSLSDYLKTH